MAATSPVAAQGSSAPDSAEIQRKKVVVRADKGSGKLVTRVVTQSAGKSARPDMNISKIVEDASRANGVDPLLVHSVIRAESAYNPFAVSSKGARGLMQLMPGTAQTLGVTNSFDPKQNIEAGVRYLKQLQDQFHDDRLALAAYNAGPRAVERFNTNVPPYAETQQYVKKVGEFYQQAQKAAGIDMQPAPLPESAGERVTEEDTHPKLEQFVDEQGRLHLRMAPR